MRNLFICLPLLAFPLASQAADSVTVNITGTLIAPTVCNVTKSGDIDFGEIKTDKINGTEYKKDLGVELACTDRNNTDVVYVTLTGTGATNDKLPVTGAAKGFHLALKKGSTAQNFDTKFRVDTNGSLGLNITPENIPAEQFVTGAFTAAITVKVDIV